MSLVPFEMLCPASWSWIQLFTDVRITTGRDIESSSLVMDDKQRISPCLILNQHMVA